MNLFAISLNTIPSEIILQKDNGGLIKDNSAWSSSMIKDKVSVLFYIDPDEKSVNEHFTKILKQQHFSLDKFRSIAIINLAATWKPNFLIQTILKEKQREFPNTIYVEDKRSILVKHWQLKDNSSEILIFSKDGKILFYNSGKISYNNITKAIEIIKNNL
jgi:predicted transcriptional regulator